MKQTTLEPGLLLALRLYTIMALLSVPFVRRWLGAALAQHHCRHHPDDNLVCIVAMVAIPLLALPYVRLEYLVYTRIPLIGGTPFDPAAIQLIAGIMR